MPRSMRPAAPQTFRHCWNRGVRKTAMFLDDHDHRKFLSATEQSFEMHEIDLVAFCLVGNHYHLLTYDQHGVLSDAMQVLGTTYARYFNDRYGLSGSVFQGRFESKTIANDAHLLVASRYVHRNVLDIAPNGAMDSYRWSSYRSYVTGDRSDVRLGQVGLILNLAGSRGAYRTFVETESPGDSTRSLEPATWGGDSDPAKTTFEHIERAIRLHLPEPDLVFDRAQQGRANPARSIAVLLAADMTGADRPAVAEHYGYQQPADLSSAIAKLRRRETTDPEFHSLVATIRRYLAA